MTNRSKSRKRTPWDERLGPLYLLGYHNFNDYMFCGNRNEKTEE